MPTYDLRCTGCTNAFEVFRQGFLRDEDRVCPSCGAPAEQMITGFVTCRSSSQTSRGHAAGAVASASPPVSGHHHGGCGCGGH